MHQGAFCGVRMPSVALSKSPPLARFNSAPQLPRSVRAPPPATPRVQLITSTGSPLGCSDCHHVQLPSTTPPLRTCRLFLKSVGSHCKGRSHPPSAQHHTRLGDQIYPSDPIVVSSQTRSHGVHDVAGRCPAQTPAQGDPDRQGPPRHLVRARQRQQHIRVGSHAHDQRRLQILRR
jgi:hypothetical protein